MTRGQPPKIQPGRYSEVIDLLRSGFTMRKAAAELGVAVRTLNNLAARDDAMGARMRAAQAEGRALHRPSESCYVNRSCRDPECIAAATAARQRRRQARRQAAASTNLTEGEPDG